MSARSVRRARERELRRESKRQGRLARKATTAAGAAFGATALFAPGAEAANFTVNSLNDPGSGTCDATECTLREAIDAANANPDADVVTFASGLSGSITLTAGDIEITSDVEVQGPGADQLSVNGNATSRIFDIDGAGNQVSLSGLTVTNGREDFDGGAIVNDDADLTLINMVISNSVSGEDGGAIDSDDGSLIVERSVITGNEAAGSGGGIAAYDQSLSISASTVSDNDAVNGDGGGLYFSNTEADTAFTMTSSTLYGNSAGDRGGGGVTIFGASAASSIANSTISGNEAADRGGGVYFYSSADAPMAIRNSTIVDNEAVRTGGGVYRYGYENDGVGGEDNLTISSTIVANNTAPDGDLGDQDSTDAPGDPEDVDGSFILGFSLIENPGEAVRTEDPAGSNIFGQDPQLGPLADNGGPTETHLPALASPAIDAGISNGLTTDQRGLQRTVDRDEVANRSGSDGTDIGSVELQAPAQPPSATANCQGTELKRTDGTEGPDSITGTDLPDAIFGLGGDDLIKGIVGDDCIDGGDGNDKLKGGGGDDLVKGDAGKDRLKGQGGKDKLKGGDGKDRILGEEGRDRLAGGGGADKMRGGPAKDRYKGGAGADNINSVDNKRDKVNCGGGQDKATVDELDKVNANCENVSEVEAK